MEQIREKLETERNELRTLMQSLIESARLDEPLGEAITELSSYDNHPGDTGSQLFERSKDFGLLEITKKQLFQIEKALKNLDSGRYGLCESCGNEISPKRLEALPGALLCLKCKKAGEDKDERGRPIEEKALFPPFGRTFTDETDSIIFDRKDAWQAVARYGTSSYTETDDDEE